MPGICRNSVDSAGGALIASQSSVTANGKAVVVDGDDVTPHGISPHDAPTITAGSNSVTIGGKAVCNKGDSATCGHTASGSDNVIVGD